MKSSALNRKLMSLQAAVSGNARISFSQCGEDLIMKGAVDHYQLRDIHYLDLGANEPVKGSNTYFFYQRGYTGVLVEPNPVLCQKLKAARPKDVCLNIGVGIGSDGNADYYVFAEEHSAYNTFSAEEKDACIASGVPLKQVLNIPLLDINTIIKEHFSRPPEILSIDVESMDEAIIRSLDFEQHAPLIICAETASLSGILSGTEEKRRGLIDFIVSKGYFIYGDTYLNTIFCSKTLLSGKKG